jgi:peptidoglycan/xylan/chitin deacetylase (PgdA/CDA1 family)
MIIGVGMAGTVFSQGAAPTEDRVLLPSDGTLRRIHVPILMYHYVSPLPPDADEIRIDLTVPPDVFRQHMQLLEQEGYKTISLNQLYDALVTGTALPPKPIVLTFDDGYIDHYRFVFPILQEFGFSGTFFIITETADFNTSGHLSWAQITEMANAGMRMESHTKTHLDLRNRDWDFLVHQVMGSFESLQAHTGQTPSVFCYPAGRYDEVTLETLAQLPVSIAVTTQYGAYHTTNDRLEVPRLRMSSNTTAANLANMLEGSR